MSSPTERQFMPPLVGSDSALLALLPFPALLFDMESLLVSESNRYFCKECNIQLTRLLTKYDYRFFTTDEFKGISSLLKLNNQYSIHKLLESNNEIRTFEISFNLLPDGNNVFLYINELSAPPAENDLFFSESKNQFLQFKELIDSANEGIGLIDADYKVVLYNSAFARFFSIVGNSLIGTDLPELLKANKPDILAELEINKFGLETTFELAILLQDIENQYFEFHTTPKFDSRNTYTGSIITIRNKTALKQSEKELSLSKEKAMEADRLKSTFLTNMSHEIRTPMNSILGFSSLLKRKGLTKVKRDQYLEIICSKGKHLMSVISDIIDITKIEEHQIKLSSGPCDLNQLMENLFDTFQYEVVKSGNQVKLFLNSTFHKKNDCVVIDSERLIQVLTNLLNNSLKFTESGYIEFGFKYVDSQTLFFYVKDTGIGVLPEMGEVIFERFRQADESYTRGFEGTGLGLSICKGLVDLMGGKIWVESDGICGSTFSFTLPVLTYEGYSTVASGNPANSTAIQSKTILIIEDDQASYQLLREYLEMVNCNVLHAFDGNEALHQLQESENIDLILLDIQLPVMDGYQVARSIRQINPTVPIIAQTAHALGSDKFKCREAGCDDFLSKPIQFDLLEKMIQGYFS